MLTITSFYSNFYYNCIDHFFQKNSISKERTLFFDIETTGLSHKTSHIYLIGAAVFEKTSFKLYQFLAEHETSEEETALLQSFYKLCSDRDCLIHFNGTTFDIGLCVQFHFYFRFLILNREHWNLSAIIKDLIPWTENT